MSSAFNSSYLFGEDKISGWGWRYFFSFYSEFGEGKNSVIFECSVFGCIFILSILTNLAIATALLRYPEMQMVNNCFLLNLMAADLAFVAGIPALIVATIHDEWRLGDAICKLLPYSQFVCGFVLLWMLTWISMDRYRCIVVPPFRSPFTSKIASILSAITWLIAFVVFLPMMFWFRVQRVSNNQHVCTLVFPRSDRENVSLMFMIPTLLLACVVPLTLFVFHYQRILHKLNEMRDRWKRNDRETKFPGEKPDVLRQHEEARVNRHARVVRVLLFNVLVVLVMWLPITVIMFLIYVDGSRPNEDTDFFLRSHHFIRSLQLALLNTAVNPLLCGVLSENFKKYVSRMWFLSQRRKALNKEVYHQGLPIVGTKSLGSLKEQMQFANSISNIE